MINKRMMIEKLKRLSIIKKQVSQRLIELNSINETQKKWAYFFILVLLIGVNLNLNPRNTSLAQKEFSQKGVELIDFVKEKPDLAKENLITINNTNHSNNSSELNEFPFFNRDFEVYSLSLSSEKESKANEGCKEGEYVCQFFNKVKNVLFEPLFVSTNPPAAEQSPAAGAKPPAVKTPPVEPPVEQPPAADTEETGDSTDRTGSTDSVRKTEEDKRKTGIFTFSKGPNVPVALQGVQIKYTVSADNKDKVTYEVASGSDPSLAASARSVLEGQSLCSECLDSVSMEGAYGKVSSESNLDDFKKLLAELLVGIANKNAEKDKSKAKPVAETVQETAETREERRERVRSGELSDKESALLSEYLVCDDDEDDDPAGHFQCLQDTFSDLMTDCEESIAEKSEELVNKSKNNKRKFCSKLVRKFYNSKIKPELEKGLAATPGTELFRSAVRFRNSTLANLKGEYNKLFRSSITRMSTKGLSVQAQGLFETSLGNGMSAEAAFIQSEMFLKGELNLSNPQSQGRQLYSALSRNGSINGDTLQAAALYNGSFRTPLQALADRKYSLGLTFDLDVPDGDSAIADASSYLTDPSSIGYLRSDYYRARTFQNGQIGPAGLAPSTNQNPSLPGRSNYPGLNQGGSLGLPGAYNPGGAVYNNGLGARPPGAYPAPQSAMVPNNPNFPNGSPFGRSQVPLPPGMNGNNFGNSAINPGNIGGAGGAVVPR